MSEAANGAGESLRVDKWLWHARFFKSRSLATAMVAAGRLRVNEAPTSKPHYRARPGDVLTFPQARAIRVVRVRALGTRRGPAAEAVTLYEDLAPPEPAHSKTAAPRAPGAGRPTKSDRRAIERLKGDA